jgi:Glycosyltransferase family 29 (sialyltransferase)
MRLAFGREAWQRWIAERRSRRELQALLDSLDGKSIAIVGNATSLLSYQYGSLIDEHEIVTRMNMGFPVDPAAQGTRFDLWCFSSYRATLQAPKGFVAPRSVWMSPKFRDRTDHGVGCYFYPMSYWRKLHHRFGARPSVGAMTIDLVSRSNPRQVTIIGFDFNRSKTFYEKRELASPHDFGAEERYVTELVARRSWRFVTT